MGLTDEGNAGIPATMLVGPTTMGTAQPYPVYMQGGGNNSDNFGGDGWWIILLILLASGGWGNGFGGFGGMGGFAADGAMLYPWMNQAEVTTNGFQNLSTQNQITAVQSDLGDIQTQLCGGFADVQQSLCNGFAGVNATVNAGFANAEASANTRQMANMQQAFNAQTAVTSAINGLASQQADCCCENRLATCQTQNIIQNEGNATRFADANNTRDILTAITSGIQSIKDDLCQDRLDAERRENANLRQELLFARGQASQISQNADIINGVYNRLNECPVGTVPVYGEQPIFTCPNNNNNCGCGCGGNF